MSVTGVVSYVSLLLNLFHYDNLQWHFLNIGGIKAPKYLRGTIPLSSLSLCLVSVSCQSADSMSPESTLCRATEMLLPVTIEDVLSTYTQLHCLQILAYIYIVIYAGAFKLNSFTSKIEDSYIMHTIFTPKRVLLGHVLRRDSLSKSSGDGKC